MRILIIGGTGFIGPHVVRRLADEGHEITVFHRGQHEPALPPSVRHVHDQTAEMPIRHFPNELIRNDFDVVLHMIAMGKEDTEAAVRAFRGRVGRMVVVSSQDVYAAYGRFKGTETSGATAAPLSEEASMRDVLFPYRALAQGPSDLLHTYEKILVERAVMADPEVVGTILRLPAVYGPGDPYHRFFPYLKRMNDGRGVIVISEGQARWRWTHGYVENVAAAVCLGTVDARAGGSIFNVGEQATPTVIERIRALACVTGWRGRMVEVARARLPASMQDTYDYTQDLVADTTRFRSALGYEEPVADPDALQRTVSWELSCPPTRVDPAQFDYVAEDQALKGL